MALIRHSNAATIARDAVVLDLGDLRRQGEIIKLRAREEAERIVAEARAERERLLKTAAEEGRAAGVAKGIEEGRKKGEDAGKAAAMAEFKQRLDALEKAWGAALAGFDAQREQLLMDARQEVVRLALRIGELVTKRAVAADPDRAADQVGAILQALTRPTRAVVAVHPDDRATVERALPALAARIAGAQHVELVADESLSRGSCVLRAAGGGEIDGTIETQLGRIAAALLPAEDPAGAGEAGP
jgi:flagellar biosynthesis/type III secretory pathway protein FliH